MKVKAKQKGQYEGNMYMPGEVFEINEKNIAPWMEPVKIIPIKVQSNMLPKHADFNQPKAESEKGE